MISAGRRRRDRAGVRREPLRLGRDRRRGGRDRQPGRAAGERAQGRGRRATRRRRCTTARPARTCSTPRRCSSPSARWSRCAATCRRARTRRRAGRRASRHGDGRPHAAAAGGAGHVRPEGGRLDERARRAAAELARSASRRAARRAAGTLAALGDPRGRAPRLAVELGLQEPALLAGTRERTALGELAGVARLVAAGAPASSRATSRCWRRPRSRGAPNGLRRLDGDAAQAQPGRCGRSPRGSSKAPRASCPRSSRAWCRSTSARPARGRRSGEPLSDLLASPARQRPGLRDLLEGLEVDADADGREPRRRGAGDGRRSEGGRASASAVAVVDQLPEHAPIEAGWTGDVIAVESPRRPGSRTAAVLCRNSLGSNRRHVGRAADASVDSTSTLVRYDHARPRRSPTPPGPYDDRRPGRDVLDLLDHLRVRSTHTWPAVARRDDRHVARHPRARADRRTHPYCCTSAQLGSRRGRTGSTVAAAVREGGVDAVVGPLGDARVCGGERRHGRRRARAMIASAARPGLHRLRARVVERHGPARRPRPDHRADARHLRPQDRSAARARSAIADASRAPASRSSIGAARTSPTSSAADSSSSASTWSTCDERRRSIRRRREGPPRGARRRARRPRDRERDRVHRPFQEFITRGAWGDVWTREGLDRRTRSASRCRC